MANPTPNPELPSNIVQTLETATAKIYLSDSNPANIYAICEKAKNGLKHTKFTQPCDSVCISIANSSIPDQWVAAFQVHAENLPLGSIFGIISALKFNDNESVKNTQSVINCDIYRNNEKIDNCPVSLPDKRMTKIIYHYGWHKYIFWREDIVVCCKVSYECMGRQSGHEFTQEIAVPQGTTAINFENNKLTFVGETTSTVDYFPWAPNKKPTGHLF